MAIAESYIRRGFPARDRIGGGPGAVEDPDPSSTRTIDITLAIDFQPVRIYPVLAGHGTEDAICGAGEQV